MMTRRELNRLVAAVALCLTAAGIALSARRVTADVTAFPDVTPDHPHYWAVQELANRGVVQGYEDGTFKPEQSLTRAEFTKMVIAATQPQSLLDDCLRNPASFPLFGDVPDPQLDWYVPFVCRGKEVGAVQGYPDGTFRPHATINMAESATIVARTFRFTPQTPLPPEAPWYEGPRLALDERGIIKFEFYPATDINRGQMASLLASALLAPAERVVLLEDPTHGAAGQPPVAASSRAVTLVLNSQQSQPALGGMTSSRRTSEGTVASQGGQQSAAANPPPPPPPPPASSSRASSVTVAASSQQTSSVVTNPPPPPPPPASSVASSVASSAQASQGLSLAGGTSCYIHHEHFYISDDRKFVNFSPYGNGTTVSEKEPTMVNLLSSTVTVGTPVWRRYGTIEPNSGEYMYVDHAFVSADGKTSVIEYYKSGEYFRTYSYNYDTAQLRTIDGNSQYITVDGAGQKVTYFSRTSGEGISLDSVNGGAKQILAIGDLFARPFISPDGNYVVYNDYNSNGLMVMPLNNESGKWLHEGVGVGTQAWVSDGGRYVLSNSAVYDTVQQTITYVPGTPTGMSRNGRYVTYRTSEWNGSTWDARVYLFDYFLGTTREIYRSNRIYPASTISKDGNTIAVFDIGSSTIVLFDVNGNVVATHRLNCTP